MKKYLLVTWTDNGTSYSNPLKLSEARLIAKISVQFPNSTFSVTLKETTKRRYNSLFGLYDVNDTLRDI